MKTIYFLLAVLISTSAVNAQSKDSTANFSAKKHEIGMILNPIGIILLGAEPTGQRFGVAYKQNFKKPSVFLTSGVYYQGYNNKLNSRNELTLEVNGPLRNVQYNRESANKILVGLGAEKRKVLNTCPQIVAYFGAELLFAYGEVNASIGNQWMQLDTTIHYDYAPQNLQPAGDFMQTRSLTTTTIGGGFQLNTGLQFHLSKRMYLFAQTAPSFLLSSSTRSERDLLSKTTTTYKASQFDFDMRALIGDIGLFYRF